MESKSFRSDLAFTTLGEEGGAYEIVESKS
jgi:hypothetical protein